MKANKDTWTKEVHENWFHNIRAMRVLLIGSFPPHRKKWSMNFYYPNKYNHFWRIFAGLAKTELKYFEGELAVEERKKIMEKLKLGVEDMGKTILRKNHSASDADIQITSYHDILGIISKNRNIKVIIAAGFHDDNSAYESLIRYLKENNIDVNLPPRKGAGQRFSFIYKKRHICGIMLNSTSKATRKPLEELIEQYSFAIFGDGRGEN